MSSRSTLGWVALVLGVVAVGMLVVAPSPQNNRALDPTATGPAGARGVVLLVEELGGEVAVRPAVPDDADTALLLFDTMDEDARADLRGWVRRGGVLVVADLGSPLAELDADACPAAVGDVDVLRFSPNTAVQRGADCFEGTVSSRSIGDGHVVTVSTAAPFINELLDQDDNAVLAAALLVPTGRETMVFVHGGVGGGDQRLLDLLGPGVAQGLVQAGVALVVYVLWRARRLGRPITERRPVRVAGSELVAAVGRLLAARQRPGDAAATIRQDLVRDLERRTGTGAGAPDAVVAAVATRTGLDPAWVTGVLFTRPVAGDGDLVDLTADLDRIRRLALDAGAPADAATAARPADPTPDPEPADPEPADPEPQGALP